MTLRLFSAAGLVLCLAASSCSDATETIPPERTSLRLARTTASDLEPALARLPDLGADIVSEGGSSITSLIDLQQRKVDVSVPLADVAYLAYAGQLEEIAEPFDQLRGMAVTDLSTMHFLVGPKMTARSMRDLKGLRVSLGAPNSSTSLMTPRLLQAHGVPPSEVRTDRLPNAEMLSRLVSGDIDASFSSYAVPSQPVTAAMKNGVRLIDIAGPVVEEMRTRYPYLKRTLIVGGTYPNQPETVHTIGIDVVLVCRADLEDDVVYRLLDAYFATQPAMTPPNLERAPATPIPLHPGAARYYRQRELSR
jgi:TRAP transporter TAXI family solute receptor